MKYIVHKAADRIVNDLGWLRIHASFRSSSDNPDQHRFGKLVILDDATMIPGGRGFTLHPHSNMEIISWILSGTDEHQDSKNGITLLHGGDVQLMSAGTGIEHAENNHSDSEGIHMFQIWIEPGTLNVAPAYQVKSLLPVKPNERYTFITPDGEGDSLIIQQRAYVSMLALEPQHDFTYKPFTASNGVYLFVLAGRVAIDGQEFANRDAVGVYPGQDIVMMASQNTRVVFVEVPMD